MILFKHNDLVFELSTPEYELPVFGFKIGELRLINASIPNTTNFDIIPLSGIINYFTEHNIRICTFRGKEDIKVVRELEKCGFLFVSSYNVVECAKNDFRHINIVSKFNVEVAKESDFDEILAIEKLVKDYSTFSIDPLISDNASSSRNVIRVRSHFSKKNHRIYIVKVDSIIAGFIQFVVDYEKRIAHTLNAAIRPEYQGNNIGKVLFSDSFKAIFSDNCDLITSDYSTQNIGSARLHEKCNFKIIRQDIHLRLFL